MLCSSKLEKEQEFILPKKVPLWRGIVIGEFMSGEKKDCGWMKKDAIVFRTPWRCYGTGLGSVLRKRSPFETG